MGIKPLYVAEVGQNNSTLVFGSELRAMLASGLVERRISPRGLSEYLRFGVVLQPHTMIEGVRLVSPGTVEQFVAGRPPLRRRYWSMPAYAPRYESFDEAASRLRGEVEESVRLHALADAPLGAFLSGGIDSTSIVSLMRPIVSRLHTYTFRFPDVSGNDESTAAAETAQRLDCVHHVVDVTGRDALAALPKFADEIDQPSIDGINTWFLRRRLHTT
jgi:asparagine synthase (glutamine-hydrolysing)